MDELALFLSLRAEEIADNGMAIYMIVAKSVTVLSSKTPEAYLSLLSKAFEHAAAEFQSVGEVELAKLTEQALTVAKIPEFFLDEHDVRSVLSRESVSKVFSLQEINADDVLVDGKTGKGLAAFIWSWAVNSIMSTVGPWIDSLKSSKNNTNLLHIRYRIIEAVKQNFMSLSEKHYPDGKHYVTYLYFVVKRLPRQ